MEEMKEICEDFFNKNLLVRVDTKSKKSYFGFIKKINSAGILIINDKSERSAFVEFGAISGMVELDKERNENGNGNKYI